MRWSAALALLALVGCRSSRLATSAGTVVGHWDPSLSSPGMLGQASDLRTAHEESVTTANGVVLRFRYETGFVDVPREGPSLTREPKRVSSVLRADVVCEKADDWHVSKGTFSPDAIHHPDDPDGVVSLDFDVLMKRDTRTPVPGGAHETLEPIYTTLNAVLTVRLHGDGRVTVVRDQTQSAGVAP